MAKKNYGKSVRTKLLNLMNETGYKYMYLLSRYFNERLLYRVSVSQYKDHFLLKGGSLLYAVNGLEARPTVDIDFMAENISRDREFLAKVFQEILCIPCDEDGVTFDASSIKVEPITVAKKYPGTRFFFIAHMDSIVHQMSVDIGFGDVVTPCPASMDFPLLLTNVPSVNLQAYSLETVIAEKLHTMIDRDTQNSRMKDFFDCYQLLTSRNISMDTLYEAVKATFDNRELQYNANLQLFTPSFVSDTTRIARWKSFLKSIQWKEALDFAAVMQVINKDLYPLVDKYWSSQNSKRI